MMPSRAVARLAAEKNKGFVYAARARHALAAFPAHKTTEAELLTLDLPWGYGAPGRGVCLVV
jgi:hypothetical protein